MGPCIAIRRSLALRNVYEFIHDAETKTETGMSSENK